MRHWKSFGALAVALGMMSATQVGCDRAEMSVQTRGDVGDISAGSCGVGPSPLRRLTRREYNNTLRDVLHDSRAPAASFPEEEEAHGFNNNADALSMSTSLVEAYLNAAEQAAARAASSAAQWVPCPEGSDRAACARRFIEDVGARLFRRPLTAEDVTSFEQLYATAKAHDDGLARVLEAMLQSPEFIYRVERGLSIPSTRERRKLDSWEVASRLSYLLWGSAPDEQLRQAAAAGKLETSEELTAQVDRMMEDPRARETVMEFHGQWLRLSRIDLISKDDHAFPTFKAEHKELFKSEVRRFLEDVLWGRKGSGVRGLFTANHTFVNEELATYYGLPTAGIQGWTRVELPPERSSGFLTQGGLMAVLAKPNGTSPVQRGLFVRNQILCEDIPPPPDNVELTPPNSDANATAADQLAQHRIAACAGCHSRMDPIGLSFENFDGIGRYRTTDKGKTLSPEGEIVGTAIGKYQNVSELGQKLAQSPQVQGCLATHWVRFGYGRSEAEADDCTVQTLKEKLVDPNFTVRDLLLLLVQSDSFRYRTSGDAPLGDMP